MNFNMNKDKFTSNYNYNSNNIHHIQQPPITCGHPIITSNNNTVVITVNSLNKIDTKKTAEFNHHYLINLACTTYLTLSDFKKFN